MDRALFAAVALATTVSCGGAPTLAISAAASPAPAVTAVPASPPPPVIASVTVLKLAWAYPVYQRLVFPDDDRVVIGLENEIALVDLAGKRVIGGPLYLGSERRLPAYPTPFSPTRYRELRNTVWACDRGRNALLAAVRLGSMSPVPDRGLGIWEPAAQPVPTPLTGVPADPREPVALSPAAGLLLVRTASSLGSAPDGIQAYDLATRAPLGAPVVTSFVSEAVFAPNGRAALGNDQGDVMLLSPRTGELITLPRAHSGYVTDLAFDPVRPRLASSAGDVVRLWNLDASPPTSSEVARGASLPAFSPDGRYLAVALPEGIVVLDAGTLATLSEPYRPKQFGGYVALAFSPDSRHLVAAGSGGVVILDIAAPTGAAPASSAAVAPDDTWFARIQRLPVPDPEIPPPIVSSGVIEGRVLADGKPVAGAEIRLTPHSNEWPDAQALAPIVTRAGRDGRYALTAVPRILWNMSILAPRRLESGGVVDLREQIAYRGVEYDLKPSATVELRIRRANGKPAARALVHYTLYPGSGITIASIAGRDGRVTLDHLSPSPSSLIWAQAGDEAMSAGMPVTGTASTQMDVRLLPADDPKVIRLRVVSEDGTPLAGVDLLIDFTLPAVTSKAGRFTFAALAGRDSSSVQLVRRIPGVDRPVVMHAKIRVPQTAVFTVTMPDQPSP